MLNDGLRRWQELRRQKSPEEEALEEALADPVSDLSIWLCFREPELANEAKEMARAKRRARTADRRVRRVQQTPSWANREAIQRVYEEAQRLSDHTGLPHHVDHIIPLRGKLVCGLHVEQNLRVIPGSENVRKSNRYEPEEK